MKANPKVMEIFARPLFGKSLDKGSNMSSNQSSSGLDGGGLKRNSVESTVQLVQLNAGG